MKKRLFVILGVSILLTLLIAGCAMGDGMTPEKFPEPRLDFGDGWVKIEYLDGSRRWVQDQLPPGRAWGQLPELPEMTIRKDAEYQISFDTSFVIGNFLKRYTVAKTGDSGEDAADVIYEEDPEITWVDWTITFKDKFNKYATLTAEQCIENLPPTVNLYANEYFKSLRETLKDEILKSGHSGPPFLSTVIAPDTVAGSGRPAVINSNDPFDVFTKTECTMTYTVRFTYIYQYRNDPDLKKIAKTEDKIFTIRVVP
jgi:hypothetical protein